MSGLMAWEWSDVTTIAGTADLLVALLIRVTGAFLVGTTLTWLWRSASAAQRHLIWSLVCGCVLAIPALYAVAPQWRIQALPTEYGTLSTALRSVGATSPRSSPAAAVAPAGVSVPSTSIQHPSPTIKPSAFQQDRAPGWGALIFLSLGGMWVAGAVLVLASLVRSHRTVLQMLAVAAPLEDRRAHQMLGAIAKRFGWSHPVELKEHPTMVPVAYGLVRPTIVLPSAARGWSDERLWNVLSHEMAHVVRYDGLSQAMGSLVCALYWFHPGAWHAARQLRREREHACDDRVMHTGSSLAGYATDLLELAHTFTQGRAVGLTALPFARTSQVYHRLVALADRTKSRTMVSPRMAAVAVATAVALSTVAAACRIGPQASVPPDSVRAEEVPDRNMASPDSAPVATRLIAVALQPDDFREMSASAVISADSVSRIALILTNSADTAVEVHPRLVSVRTKTSLRNEISTAIGSSRAHALAFWLRGLPDTVRLEPQEQKTIILTVSPPEDVDVGTYYVLIEIPEFSWHPPSMINFATRIKEKPNPTSRRVDIPADSAGPFYLILARKGTPRAHLYVDSLELVEKRWCVRMWTEHGLPYFGAAQVELQDPRQPIPSLYSEALPIVLDGVSSPTRYCRPLPELSDYSGELVRMSFLTVPTWWGGDQIFEAEDEPSPPIRKSLRLPAR